MKQLFIVCTFISSILFTGCDSEPGQVHSDVYFDIEDIGYTISNLEEEIECSSLEEELWDIQQIAEEHLPGELRDSIYNICNRIEHILDKDCEIKCDKIEQAKIMCDSILKLYE